MSRFPSCAPACITVLMISMSFAPTVGFRQSLQEALETRERVGGDGVAVQMRTTSDASIQKEHKMQEGDRANATSETSYVEEIYLECFANLLADQEKRNLIARFKITVYPDLGDMHNFAKIKALALQGINRECPKHGRFPTDRSRACIVPGPLAALNLSTASDYSQRGLAAINNGAGGGKGKFIATSMSGRWESGFNRALELIQYHKLREYYHVGNMGSQLLPTTDMDDFRTGPADQDGRLHYFIEFPPI